MALSQSKDWSLLLMQERLFERIRRKWYVLAALLYLQDSAVILST